VDGGLGDVEEVVGPGQGLLERGIGLVGKGGLLLGVDLIALLKCRGKRAREEIYVRGWRKTKKSILEFPLPIRLFVSCFTFVF